jgi:hypothetical protein
MNLKFTLYSLTIIVLMFSCTIEKRLYRPGYNIQFSKNQIQRSSNQTNDINDLNSSVSVSAPLVNKVTLNPISSVSNSNEIEIETTDIASNNEFELVVLKNKENDKLLFEPIKAPAMKINSDCDVIVCNNGDEIEAKVIEIGISEIKYKKCSNLEGPTISIRNTEVLMIKYPNGTKDVIKQTVSNQNSEPKTNAFALVSMITGILSLLTLFGGLLFGAAAIVFAELAYRQFEENLEKYKSSGLKMAKAGMIMGVIGFAAGLIVLLVLL